LSIISQPSTACVSEPWLGVRETAAVATMRVRVGAILVAAKGCFEPLLYGY
jgi:hypothetical protein